MFLRLFDNYLSVSVVLFIWLLSYACLVDGSQIVLKSDDELSITNDILSAAHEANVAKSCRSCQALLIPLKRLATIGDDRFVSTVTGICKARKVRLTACFRHW